MDETVAGIAAFVGAAAWLPQIGAWVYKWLRRPMLTIIPDEKPEIGYKTFGPMFNMRLALAVDKEDILVTKLGVTLTHESGQKRTFSWKRILQTFSAVRDNQGVQQATLEREQGAIAIKVCTVGLVEMDFRFLDDECTNTLERLTTKAAQHQRFLQETKGDEASKLFLESQPYHELETAMRELFCWQAGKYRIVLTAQSPSRLKLKQRTMHFSLTQADIDDLRGNLKYTSLVLRAYALGQLEQQLAEPIPWAWKNPNLVVSRP